MSTTSPIDPKHYVRLPICGYCGNAWDIVFGRPPWHKGPGRYTAEEWLGHCRVGGCDPDIWEFLEDPFVVEYDNRVYHRREDDEPNAPWRRMWPKIVAQWAAIKNSRFTDTVTDRVTGQRVRVVAVDEIDWGEPETVPAADEDIEW